MKYRISDVASINESSISKSTYIGSVNYVDTSSVISGNFNGYRHYPSISEAPSRARRLVSKEDTVISTVRPNMKHVGFISSKSDCIYSTGFAVVSPKKDKIDPYYLYLFLSSNRVTEVLQSIGETSTSTYPSVKPSDIGNLVIDMPPLDEQHLIANRIRLIDEKKNQNSQINANLTNQIKITSNSFFSYFEASNGDIPKNWHYKKLTDIANIDTGYSYKSSELKPNNMAMATIKNFNRVGGFNIEGFKEIRPNKVVKNEKYAKKFDILVAHTDLTQNADIIGNAEPILDISDYKNVIFSMDLVKVTSKDNLISQFLLSLILQGEALKAHCLGYINGTTVLHLSKKALKEFEIPLPDNLHELDNINHFAQKSYLIMANNLTENRYLQSVKEELLKKYF
ncbi:restriction endonuclease subunit S [Limosilactobacillus fermentum]|uniref:restriction endonuclease subunit S n=1 Tax=Limosilactobacillus fermentum TaxID=1613 RepID=UPI0021CB5305|nr:restriction endonuclease subunit S [Limosilactobacillus fermentum]